MQTLHGNTLVHLFTPPFPPYANTPRPPLEERTERAQIEVFHTPYELPDAPRTAPLEQPQQSFRLHQEIPENGPTAESQVLRLLGRPNNSGQNKDKNTPAVVVSYQLNQKNERANNSHKMNSLWQPKVVVQETLPRTTEQTQGGVVPDPLEQQAEAPVPSVNERDLPNSNNQQKSPHKRTNDLLPKIEVLDDVMDISGDSNDSIPPLFYPKSDEE